MASAEAERKVEKFAAMSPAELRAHEREAIRGVLDLELIPPVVETAPDQSVYGFPRLDFAMNGGMAQTAGGRLYAVWFAGADGPGAFLVGTWSDDGGKSWVGTKFVVGQKEPLASIGFARIYRSILIGNVWCSPDGVLRLYVYQAMNMFDGRGAIFEFVCRNPDAPHPTWGAARYLGHGGLHNKPIVLGAAKSIPKEFAFEMPEYRAANVFASKDKGQTVSFWGRAQIPPKDRDCTENMVIERRDGTLWMLVRVKYGIAETVSSDGGKTWSELRPSAILNPNSRFFIGRLKSGAMLLVKNGPVGTKTGRSHITAFVSDDDGATWQGGLVLDERKNVSYPDAVESADGFIHVVHDRERTKAREILHHRFTEADVRAGRLVTPGSRLKGIVNKAGPK